MKKISAMFFVSAWSAFLVSLVAFPGITQAQVQNGEKIAASDIPSVFQVFVGANATISFPQFDVDADMNVTPHYRGVTAKVAKIVANLEDDINNNGDDIATAESDESADGVSAADLAAAEDVIQHPANYAQEVSFSENTVLQSGSGFVIGENGYVVTNAHVVTVDSSDIEDALASDYLNGSSTDNLYATLGIDPSSDNGDNLFYNLQDYIEQYASVTSSTISYKILPPSIARTASYDEVITNGWDASLVYKGEPYPGKDVALLKLSLNYKLPALDLSEHDPSVGDAAYVIGFPGAANLTDEVENQATFTAGTVSAVRKSDNGDFSVFQVDASSGEGSSGGPVLNSAGQVVGILTLGSETDSGGGIFNYFLPVSLVTEMLSSANITLDPDRTVTNAYLGGVNLLENGNCVAGTSAIAPLQNSLDSDFINQMTLLCVPTASHVQLTGWWSWAIPLFVILIALLSYWYHRRTMHKPPVS